jgi:hypothetical protein
MEILGKSLWKSHEQDVDRDVNNFSAMGIGRPKLPFVNCVQNFEKC